MRGTILALGLLVAGCWFDDHHEPLVSVGEEGRAEFAWDAGILGCLFGCNAEDPMATRSVAYLIVMNDEDLPAFTATSEDPAVATFTQDAPGDASIRVDAVAEGSVRVVLEDAATGTVIDRFRIDVRDVASIAPSRDDLFRERFLIQAGGEETIYLRLEDEGGEELVGIGGVDYALLGELTEADVTLVDALADLIASILVGTKQDYVTIEALDLGSGALSIEAPSGASLVIPAEVVDSSAATRVDLDGPDDAEVGSSVFVDAYAFAGEEPVHSPECAWSLSPPDGPVAIDFENRDSLAVLSESPGSAVVTCTVGAASGDFTIAFR